MVQDKSYIYNVEPTEQYLACQFSVVVTRSG